VTAAQVVVACQRDGVMLSVSPQGKLRYRPAPTSQLLAQLRACKADVLALLKARTAHRQIPDPDFPHLTPDPAAEVAALAAGWTQSPDGRWRFPEAWQCLPTPTPDPAPRLRRSREGKLLEAASCSAPQTQLL